MTKQKTKSAATLHWVAYWIEHVDPSQGMVEIWANEVENKKWRCEINLPVINKTVVSVSTTQVNAMKNASDKAAKIIDEYTAEHQELKWRNPFKRGGWVFTEDSDGKFVSSGLSDVASERLKNQAKIAREETLKTIEKAINKIKNIHGSTSNLFIQVIDRKLFDKNASELDMLGKVAKVVDTEYNQLLVLADANEEYNGSFITVGYTYDK